MLYNIRQESYISGKASMLNDSSPDAIKKEMTFEGIFIL